MTGDVGVVRRRWPVVSLVCIVAIAAACARSRTIGAGRHERGGGSPPASARVLTAARTAIAGKHDGLSLRPQMMPPDVQGWSSRSRRTDVSSFFAGAAEWLAAWSRPTERPRRGAAMSRSSCSSRAGRRAGAMALRAGPLVVECATKATAGWPRRARVYPASPTPLDDFLAGDLRVDSDELEMIGARAARVFVAQWTAPASEASPSIATGPGIDPMTGAGRGRSRRRRTAPVDSVTLGRQRIAAAASVGRDVCGRSRARHSRQAVQRVLDPIRRRRRPRAAAGCHAARLCALVTRWRADRRTSSGEALREVEKAPDLLARVEERR